MLLQQQIRGSSPRSARAVNKNSNSGDVVGSSSARGVRGLPPIGHRRIFVPLFRSSRAQPHPLLSRQPPASFTPLDAHRALFLSFYSSPSSTCYHSRNGPTVVSWTRGGGRRVTQRGEGGRRRVAAPRTVETNRGREEGEGTGREAHRNSLPLLLFTQVCSASSPTRALARAHKRTDTHVRTCSTRMVPTLMLQDREAQFTHAYTLVYAHHTPRVSSWTAQHAHTHIHVRANLSRHTWPDEMDTCTHTNTGRHRLVPLVPSASPPLLSLSLSPASPPYPP